MRTFVSALVALAMLSGCATTYTGPQPDFTKTRAEAQAEQDKFEMTESYGEMNLITVEMGKKLYFTNSVEPIINKVSPSWATAKRKMIIGEFVSLGFLAAALATVFMPGDSWGHQTGYWIGLGGIIASGIYVNVVGMHAAEDYNKDLKSKFTPALAISKTF